MACASRTLAETECPNRWTSVAGRRSSAEPELGLHPFAVSVLAGLMKSASQKHQLIVSTQSVELVNEFDAEDLIVVDKRGGASTFKRPDVSALAEWLSEYSLGDLWKKNLLGGRPGR